MSEIRNVAYPKRRPVPRGERLSVQIGAGLVVVTVLRFLLS